MRTHHERGGMSKSSRLHDTASQQGHAFEQMHFFHVTCTRFALRALCSLADALGLPRKTPLKLIVNHG